MPTNHDPHEGSKHEHPEHPPHPPHPQHPDTPVGHVQTPRAYGGVVTLK
jgi:hypothetical protein